ELTLSELEWVTTINKESLQHFFLSKGFALIADEPSKISLEGEEKIKLTFYCCNQSDFFQQLFRTSASPAFLEAWNTDSSNALSEEEIFSRANLSYISPCLRESADIIESAKQGKLPELICEKDIKGIIHTHSNWSDGVNTIEEMATALIEKGFEYLVISDHSKSAFYANGLTEVKIAEQHRYIDELNKKLAPFKIFKSIECDILNDGSLDYSDDILNSFDLVITSIHSNLKMTEEKAMQRLLKAIQHPATTILGHMTGRLLLSRSGYPVDHELIIEACAAHKVVIELNAHPRRLDIDWHWIKKATDKGVLISINPDAHSIEGFNDIRYGVLAAQKGLLQASQNLSSFSLAEFEHFLKTKK
ncbi:MAG TPA: PHP domain-containing protein, partial [Parasegetibacter sp.]